MIKETTVAEAAQHKVLLPVPKRARVAIGIASQQQLLHIAYRCDFLVALNFNYWGIQSGSTTGMLSNSKTTKRVPFWVCRFL